jgi:hypothetical protein
MSHTGVGGWVPRSRLQLSEDTLHLREGFFYWIEVQRVGWEEQKRCSGFFNQLFYPLALMHREIVHDHYLSSSQLWSQELWSQEVFYVGNALPSTAPSTLIEGFTPSESMALISEMFSPQFLGALPKARSPFGALA